MNALLMSTAISFVAQRNPAPRRASLRSPPVTHLSLHLHPAGARTRSRSTAAILLRVAVAWLLFHVPGIRGAVLAVPSLTAHNGLVIAGHLEAAEAGLEILRSGGNAIDAAVATSLALGVAEPFGSGLGGKLVLLYYEAASGRISVVDALDVSGSLSTADYLQRPDTEWNYGYGSVCVPGLPAGLWLAHQRWGAGRWADDVRPAIELAARGAEIRPKIRDLFAEQEPRLRKGDAEIARLFLPGGALPESGRRLPQNDLARTLEAFARSGRDGFYRGPVAAAIVRAVQAGGGVISEEDLAGYEARITEPIAVEFLGRQIVSAPPPTCGAAMVLPTLKALETEGFSRGPLRTAANLEKLARTWRIVAGEISELAGDTPDSRRVIEDLLTPASISNLRQEALRDVSGQRTTSHPRFPANYESEQAATTHFIVVDGAGNIVCATQSLSVHFGAGVVPPGTGVVLNNSMSNFSYADPTNPNYVGPRKRPRTTIAPTLVLNHGRPTLALGLPGSSRIPTALLQVLLDRLVLDRPLDAAIGDTRFHFMTPTRATPGTIFEAEQSLPFELAASLRDRGWKVVLPEEPGRGRHFGGVNAVEFNADGTMTGYADPRRSNAVLGY
jgi:gamma-glutamyltranspeptidase/glutathione hydrolase